MNFFGLFLIFALWIGSDDAARFPETVEGPVSSSQYGDAAPATVAHNAPSVPTEGTGTQAAVNSSATGTGPVVTRETDVTDQDVATKEKESIPEPPKPDAQSESTVPPKDPSTNV